MPHFNNNEIKYTRAKIRVAQGRFRALILTNCDNCCAVTGTRLALEATHIISHASGGKPVVENGLCFAANLHLLLDRGHLMIKDNVMLLSDEAKCDSRYANLDSTKLLAPKEKVIFLAFFDEYES